MDLGPRPERRPVIPAWFARPTPWTCASTPAGASSITCAGGGVPTSKAGARYHQPAHRCTGRPQGAPPVRRPHSTGGW